MFLTLKGVIPHMNDILASLLGSSRSKTICNKTVVIIFTDADSEQAVVTKEVSDQNKKEYLAADKEKNEIEQSSRVSVRFQEPEHVGTSEITS